MAVKPGTKFAPTDILDDVSGTVMGEDEAEGMKPREVHGRWTGLYRKEFGGWHLVNVFTSRKEAYRYWNALSDGCTYRLAALSGTLRPVAVIR